MQKEIFEQPRVVGDTLEGVTGIMPELFGDEAYPRLQGDRPRADPGLRHQLLRRPDRQVLDRIGGQAAGERRDRQRIPLPRQRAASERPWSSPSRNPAKPPTPWPR
jgi:hypothetical protein